MSYSSGHASHQGTETKLHPDQARHNRNLIPASIALLSISLGPPGAVLILIITAALTVSLLGLFFKATRHVTSTVLGSLSWALVSASAVGFFLATIARRFLLATVARRLLLATIARRLLLATVARGLLLTGSVARGL
jgi:hypothetical protein